MWRAGLILVLALVACEDVESDAVLTSGMYARLQVVADGGGTSQAIAVLKVGGATSNTYVELTGDDALFATTGEVEEEMVEEQLGDYHRYVASFDSAVDDAEYVVAFERTVDEGAPDSAMELPTAFEIDTPAGTFSRAADITLTWTPSGTADNMDLYVDGDCILPYTRELEGDPGTLTIEAGTLLAVDDEAQASCDVTYTLDRWRAGTVDTAFGEGGDAAGHQQREVGVLTAP